MMTDEPSAPAESAVPETPQEVVPEVQVAEAVGVPAELEPVSAPGPTSEAQVNVEAPANVETPAPEPPVQAVETVVAAAERAREERLERPAPAPSPNIVQELLIKARAKIQARKRQKFDRIMEKLTRDGKVTNADVQKLVRVSKPTATRYLSLLEREGRLRQVGSKGKAVSYLKA